MRDKSCVIFSTNSFRYIQCKGFIWKVVHNLITDNNVNKRGFFWGGGGAKLSSLWNLNLVYDFLFIILTCLIAGLDGAGKTTLLYRLKLGEVVTHVPTIGTFKIPRLHLLRFFIELLYFGLLGTRAMWCCVRYIMVLLTSSLYSVM